MFRPNKIISIPAEYGSKVLGAADGVCQLRDYWQNNNICDINKDAYLDLINPETIRSEAHINSDCSLKRIDQVYRQTLFLNKQIPLLLKTKDKPLFLTGDHSNNIGVVLGLMSFLQPKKKMALIWIDAHADLHNPDTSPSGNLHGMVLNALNCRDSKEKLSSNINVERQSYWNDLKKRSQPFAIEYKDIFYIGLRSFEQGERDIIKKHSIDVLTVGQYRENHNRLHEVFNPILDVYDRVFISFDVDVLDPSISKGTGTPVVNGFNKNEIVDILQFFLQSPKVVGLECTEINPKLDSNYPMHEVVGAIFQAVFS